MRMYSVCMYVYIYICMYVCMYVCMHVCIYVCMYVCRRISIFLTPETLLVANLPGLRQVIIPMTMIGSMRGSAWNTLLLSKNLHYVNIHVNIHVCLNFHSCQFCVMSSIHFHSTLNVHLISSFRFSSHLSPC